MAFLLPTQFPVDYPSFVFFCFPILESTYLRYKPRKTCCSLWSRTCTYIDDPGGHLSTPPEPGLALLPYPSKSTLLWFRLVGTASRTHPSMSSEGFCQFLTRMRLDRLPSFVTFASTSLVSSSKEVEFTPGTHSRAAILGGRLIHRQSNVPSVTSLINHSSGSGFSLPNIPFRSFTLSRSGQPYHALYNRAVGFSASHYFIVLCTTKSVLLLVQLS